MFAEFLLFLLVFPVGHTSVGLTVSYIGWFSSCLVYCSVPSLFGAVKVRWGFVPIYTCARRESCSLITHISIISPMLAWDNLL